MNHFYFHNSWLMGSLCLTTVIETLIVYFKNNITAKLLKLENVPSDIEAAFIEINIKS